MNRELFEQLERRIAGVYAPEEYPALGCQCEKWIRTQPLRGLRILDASPVFCNTLVKYRALIASGAILSVGTFDAIPVDPAIVRFLREMGVDVVDGPENAEEVYDLVLDCAGAFASVAARVGYVELTRSGVERYEGCSKPVYVADSGRIKRIETMLGTGESFFRAMRQRGYEAWNDRNIVVFGSGKVGSGILFYALREGARVTAVTDPQTLDPALRQQGVRLVDKSDRQAVVQVVGEADVVVTATGVCGAVAACGADSAAVASRALLANMGVEDEYGSMVPAERVLSNKHPLNFELEEPTHLKYIDATLALHNAGAVWLTTHPGALGLITPDAADEAELLRISCERGIAGAEIAAVTC